MGLGLGLKSKLKKASNSLNYWYKNTFALPNLFNLFSSERIGVIYHDPSDMCVTDRVMLYALVRGLKPTRALEIGVRWGGSARIITNAMEENGVGQLVGIDPAPENFKAHPKVLHNRYKLLTGYSPDITGEVAKLLGGVIDFVLIDGLHTHDAVLADLQGVLPYLTPGAHIVLHDAYHLGIDQAINTVLQEVKDLVDCGFITRNPRVKEPVSYQGLRLLRYGAVNSRELITTAYEQSGFSAPTFSEELFNYDVGLKNMRSWAASQGIQIDNKGREIIISK